MSTLQTRLCGQTHCTRTVVTFNVATFCVKFAWSSTFAENSFMPSCLFFFWHCTLQEFNWAIKTEIRKFKDVTNDGKKLEKRKPQTYLFLLSIVHRVLQFHYSRRLGARQKQTYSPYSKMAAILVFFCFLAY